MYIVKSSRVGVVGTEFVPKPGTNVAALIWGGFIEETVSEPTEEINEEVSTPAPKKGAKNKRATHKE
jgi:hypothetical protein